MTSLATIKRQIAALEAEAARITKLEAASAVATIKELMTTFGLTAEHLGLGRSGGKRPKAAKSPAKRAGAGRPRYADPKTGKTWSGLGRAPEWIASAKNRDAYLIASSGATNTGEAGSVSVKSAHAGAKVQTKGRAKALVKKRSKVAG